MYLVLAFPTGHGNRTGRKRRRCSVRTPYRSQCEYIPAIFFHNPHLPVKRDFKTVRPLIVLDTERGHDHIQAIRIVKSFLNTLYQLPKSYRLSIYFKLHMLIQGIQNFLNALFHFR